MQSSLRMAVGVLWHGRCLRYGPWIVIVIWLICWYYDNNDRLVHTARQRLLHGEPTCTAPSDAGLGRAVCQLQLRFHAQWAALDSDIIWGLCLRWKETGWPITKYGNQWSPLAISSTLWLGLPPRTATSCHQIPSGSVVWSPRWGYTAQGLRETCCYKAGGLSQGQNAVPWKEMLLASILMGFSILNPPFWGPPISRDNQEEGWAFHTCSFACRGRPLDMSVLKYSFTGLHECGQPNAIILPFGDGLYRYNTHKNGYDLEMVYGIGFAHSTRSSAAALEMCQAGRVLSKLQCQAPELLLLGLSQALNMALKTSKYEIAMAGRNGRNCFEIFHLAAAHLSINL